MPHNWNTTLKNINSYLMFTVMDYTTKESLKRQLIFSHTEMSGNQWLQEGEKKIIYKSETL